MDVLCELVAAIGDSPSLLCRVMNIDRINEVIKFVSKIEEWETLLFREYETSGEIVEFY